MRTLLALIVVLLAGCRTPPLDFDGGLPPNDLAGADLAPVRDLAGIPTSCCGKQGNPGNEFGVGRFCQKSLDCQSVMARTCAASFGPNLNFCTMACSMNGPANQCGSGAMCQCAQQQCACIPGECVMPPPGC